MATMNAAELKAAVMARAQQDQEYCIALLTNPRAAIEQVAGESIPDDFELTDAELELVAAGGVKPRNP